MHFGFCVLVLLVSRGRVERRGEEDTGRNRWGGKGEKCIGRRRENRREEE